MDFLISNTSSEFCHLVIALFNPFPFSLIKCCFPVDFTTLTHYLARMIE